MRNAGRIYRAALCAFALATIVPAAAQARSSAQYRIEGRGWGHGIGMSQYGADGYAAHGLDATGIVTHYFAGTVVAPRPTDGPTDVRVLLQSYLAPATVELTSAGVLRQGSATLPLVAGDTVELRSAGLYLLATRIHEGVRTNVASGSAADATVAPYVDGGVRIKFDADYAHSGTSFRGTLTAHRFDGKVSVFNTLPIESYLRGVVGDEMSPSWHAEALKAQAIAARSYALTGIGGDYDWFDLYSDTRSQVYGGLAAEDPRTDAAVAATDGLVARVGSATGEMARTFFFSTSGGRTAGNDEVWGSAPYPYLRSVPSPYEQASSYFVWKGSDVLRLTPAQLGARLGLSGSFRTASNTVFPSGYAKDVNVATTAGPKVLSASSVQSRLGLRSTYFRINYLSIGAPNAAATGSIVKLTGRVPSAGITSLLLRTNGVTRVVKLAPMGPLGAWVVRVKLTGATTATLTRAGAAGPAIAIAAT
ncbi:MAG: SpoIID/LytB protein [Thermoleophilia bacterium]|nr:SpoIID/LytB protein [Thermoleophilia bacterium]